MRTVSRLIEKLLTGDIIRQACIKRRREEDAGVQLQLCSYLIWADDFCRYDKLAFRYVSWVAIPCLLGYTVYSLLYNTHRSWYSFVITTLTSFVYMFGFVRSLLSSCVLQPYLLRNRRNWFRS